jgi:membrane-associated phospholipid phosphatase
MLLDKSHFNLSMVSELLSALPLSFYFIPVYEYIKTRQFSQIIFLLGIFFITTSTDFIKRIPYSKTSPFYHITRRPDGASNCDYLSKCGPARPDAPGLPSGHMATTAFFCGYMYLLYPKNDPFTLFNILLIIAMGWARYFKKCHNMIQLITGTLYGGVGAYIWKYLF